MINKGYIAAVAITFGVSSLGTLLIQETVAYEPAFGEREQHAHPFSDGNKPTNAILRLTASGAFSDQGRQGSNVERACVSHIDVFGLESSFIEVRDLNGDTVYLSATHKNETVFHATDGLPTVSLKELKPKVRFKFEDVVDDMAAGKGSLPSVQGL